MSGSDKQKRRIKRLWSWRGFDVPGLVISSRRKLLKAAEKKNPLPSKQNKSINGNQKESKPQGATDMDIETDDE